MTELFLHRYLCERSAVGKSLAGYAPETQDFGLVLPLTGLAQGRIWC